MNMGQTQLDTIPTFDEIECERRARIRGSFREVVEFNNKKGIYCFYFPIKERWFRDEVSAAHWDIEKRHDGISVVLRTKKPGPKESMSWFDYLIAILCLLLAGFMYWTWPDDNIFARSTTYRY
jgi:hypothetical protein